MLLRMYTRFCEQENRTTCQQNRIGSSYSHLPTRIVVQYQNEHLQIQNKATAMKMLHTKLAQKMRAEQEEKQATGID